MLPLSLEALIIKEVEVEVVVAVRGGRGIEEIWSGETERREMGEKHVAGKRYG
jgi:hypothetical protein